MDFALTDDQLSIQSIARDFAQKRIAPVADKFDESGEFPLENIQEMGQLGLMGIEVPTKYGDSMEGILSGDLLAIMEYGEATRPIPPSYAG